MPILSLLYLLCLTSLCGLPTDGALGHVELSIHMRGTVLCGEPCVLTGTVTNRMSVPIEVPHELTVGGYAKYFVQDPPSANNPARPQPFQQQYPSVIPQTTGPVTPTFLAPGRSTRWEQELWLNMSPRAERTLLFDQPGVSQIRVSLHNVNAVMPDGSRAPVQLPPIELELAVKSPARKKDRDVLTILRDAQTWRELDDWRGDWPEDVALRPRITRIATGDSAYAPHAANIALSNAPKCRLRQNQPDRCTAVVSLFNAADITSNPCRDRAIALMWWYYFDFGLTEHCDTLHRRLQTEFPDSPHLAPIEDAIAEREAALAQQSVSTTEQKAPDDARRGPP